MSIGSPGLEPEVKSCSTLVESRSMLRCRCWWSRTNSRPATCLVAILERRRLRDVRSHSSSLTSRCAAVGFRSRDEPSKDDIEVEGSHESAAL